MATLQGRAIKDTYKDLLQVSNSNNGVDGTLRTIEDGEGTSSALQVSSGAVRVNGTLDVTGDVTGVPHVDYRGTYSSSTSYQVDDVVVYNGSSYINTAASTGVAPTNTNNWGLLASKGTDGTDGTNGIDGTTGPEGPQGPAGPAGADGADGQDFSGYSNLEQLTDGTIQITDSDAAASLILRKTGTGAGGSALFIDTDSTADGDLAAIELRGGVNLMAWRDDAPTTSSNTASALQADVNQGNTLRSSEEDFRYFNLVNSNGKFGLDSVKADNSQYASMFEFYPIKAVDGSDGSGGSYAWSNGLPHWTQFVFNGAMRLAPVDTSDVKGQMVVNVKDSALYSDQGANLVYRAKNGSGNSATRLYVSGHADTEAEVANNIALHLASDKHDTPTGTTGFRNTGRTINYSGTTDLNLELVGSNIQQYQTAIQTQKTNLRTSFTLQYEPEDSTQSDWNGGVETGLTGSASGEFAGFYLTAASSGLNQQRSLRPSGFFDGAMNLGDASTRWSTVFATSGSINQSDRNAKQDIEDLSDAEKSVAVALKGLIKKYRFKDAVNAKGDDARIHVGVIAQDVEQAFTDAGLDGFRYGILCKDTVFKVMVNGSAIGTQTHDKFVEEGPDGKPIEGATLEAEDRYAVRYDELLAFVVSAL